MVKTAKKAALPKGIAAVKKSIAKNDAKRAAAAAKKAPAKKAVKVAAKKATAKKTAAKNPNPQQAPRKVGKSPLLAAPYGMTPAVHDFAQAFKSLVSPPEKRSAASLLGDDPKPFNGVTLKELVTVFIADNKRLGELTAAAKQAGCDPQAFSIAAVLSLPYMRATKAAVELYLKVLADD